MVSVVKKSWYKLSKPEVIPPPEVLDPPSLLKGHPYTQANRTDVQATWRKFGWKPIQRKD